jgi:serine/threonine protein kinase
MIGQTLGGRYHIIKLLGRGGFGETYLAEDIHLPKRPWRVVKKLTPRSSDAWILQAGRRLFDTEAQILHQLGNHPQIPQLFAHFEENQEFYLVQEFIAGHDLSYEIKPGQVWNEAKVTALLREILDILSFVHQRQVIHRDIKPRNIIRRETDRTLVLIDFGSVKQVSSHAIAVPAQTALTIGIGTPGYMPSEQALGTPRFSSDVYAVGVMAIAALTGLAVSQLTKDPRTDEIIWRHQAPVSDRLANLLSIMVRYDFRERFTSAVEVLQALDSSEPLQPKLQIVRADQAVGRLPSPARDHPEVAIPAQFDEAYSFAEGLARIMVEDQYGYTNRVGDITIPVQFKEAYSFSDGLARVKINQSYGYINQTGDVVVPPQFTEAYSFSEGLALVRIGTKYGYIGRQGNVVIPPQFDVAYSFSEGLATVRVNSKGYGFIDPKGHLVIRPRPKAESFSGGFAAVSTVGKRFGYINKRDEMIIRPLFHRAYPFSEGIALVEIDRKVGYINTQGEIIIPIDFQSVYPLDRELFFSDGLAKAWTDSKTCVFLNTQGHIVIQAQFDRVDAFSEGVARIFDRDQGYGFIDQRGDAIVMPQYRGARSFSEGLAAVKLGNQWGYIHNPLQPFTPT